MEMLQLGSPNDGVVHRKLKRIPERFFHKRERKGVRGTCSPLHNSSFMLAASDYQQAGSAWPKARQTCGDSLPTGRSEPTDLLARVCWRSSFSTGFVAADSRRGLASKNAVWGFVSGRAKGFPLCYAHGANGWFGPEPRRMRGLLRSGSRARKSPPQKQVGAGCCNDVE